MAHTLLLPLFFICGLTSTVGPTVEPAEMLLQPAGEGQLSLDPSEVATAAVDFGGVARAEPLAVMRPGCAGDVVRLVRAAYRSARWFPVSDRGHGHSNQRPGALAGRRRGPDEPRSDRAPPDAGVLAVHGRGTTSTSGGVISGSMC
ncbi:hypothetical protein C4D60_Mb07t26980 [Musa balbisiana]|uniref:Uncharacterized protein n=1 Tax=Musa balbisiana TaxID=52838 RepID=A0A4S8JJK4_MUSBA|nr:hypothetical protein C4D60_Mb07t26980 [Musa balbisiana]